MKDKLQVALIDIMGRFIDFLPTLFGGLLLLVIGWVLAWFTKRLIVRISVILKLENLLARSPWKKAFEKADVRYGFYNFLGNVFGFIVFLIFLHLSLIAWNLNFLSDFLAKAILVLPRLIGAFAIFGIGLLIARWSANALLKALTAENIPYSSIISLYVRGMIIIVFSAMALFEFNIAREIVAIAFASFFITMSVIAILLVLLGWKTYSCTLKGYSPEKEENGAKDSIDKNMGR